MVFSKLLALHGCVGSMSRKGDCWDNAIAESFFGSLKQEQVQWRSYQTRRETHQDILNYISMFYNPHRLHSYLGSKSPMQFELQRSEMKKSGLIECGQMLDHVRKAERLLRQTSKNKFVIPSNEVRHPEHSEGSLAHQEIPRVARDDGFLFWFVPKNTAFTVPIQLYTHQNRHRCLNAHALTRPPEPQQYFHPFPAIFGDNLPAVHDQMKIQVTRVEPLSH